MLPDCLGGVPCLGWCGKPINWDYIISPLCLHHCSWHYTIKISDKRHLLLLWRLAHYFISAFTSIRLHFLFIFLLALKKNAQDKRRVNPAPQLPAPRFECNHIWMQTRPSCVPLYFSEWLAITCLFVFVETVAFKHGSIPPFFFLLFLQAYATILWQRGRGKMKRTSMLRRTRWNTHLGHRKRLLVIWHSPIQHAAYFTVS